MFFLFHFFLTVIAVLQLIIPSINRGKDKETSCLLQMSRFFVFFLSTSLVYFIDKPSRDGCWRGRYLMERCPKLQQAGIRMIIEKLQKFCPEICKIISQWLCDDRYATYIDSRWAVNVKKIAVKYNCMDPCWEYIKRYTCARATETKRGRGWSA